MSRSLRSMLLGCAALVIAPVTAHAQLERTGTSGPSDPFWSVVRVGLSAPYSANGYTGPAQLVTTTPANIWAQNTVDQQWIGTSASASTTPSTGTAASNYRYFFTTTLQEGVSNGVFDLKLGWDNRFMGAFVGGSLIGNDWVGGSSFLDLDPTWSGKSAFCRNGDGIFSSATYSAANPEACLVSATSNAVTAAMGTSVTFVLEGDGTTDGLLVKSSLVEGSTTVPEPSAIALLAMGVLGFAGVARRRTR